MSPTTNTVMGRFAERRHTRRLTAPLVALVVVVVVVAACGGSDPALDAIAKTCDPASSAPTYSQLYTKYFAAGTPGHCATAECHADPKHNIWLCGPTKDTCYRGMVEVGLINPSDPLGSKIADPRNSPLNWINPNGPMPFDDPKPFPEGRDAILAWIAACAQNN